MLCKKVIRKLIDGHSYWEGGGRGSGKGGRGMGSRKGGRWGRFEKEESRKEE